MRVVKVAAAVEEDLKAIWAYVAEYDPEAANRTVKEITNRLALIRDHPHIGREQNRLLVGLRSIVVADYFIFYQPFEDTVEVLRVLHSSRDIESIFARYFDSL